MKSFLCIPRVLVITTLTLSILANPGSDLIAQSGAPEQAAAVALDLVNRGQTEEATAAYEKVLKDYPTSLIIPEAQFRLGYLYFVQGKFDKSVEMIRKVMGPPSPAEIQEMAAGLLPQVTSGKAAKLDPNDSKRTAAFEEAIGQFDAYVAKYPNEPEVETAIYGKALAQFQIKKYEEAATGLRQNITRFAKSESILESEYLLALTLASQGKGQEAEKWLNDIITKRLDLALANEAQFQLGEIYFNRAVAASEKDRDEMYSKAIKAYQAVLSKEMISKAQQARMDGLLQRLREAGSRHDIAGVKAAQHLRELEAGKIAALKSKPETAIGAQIKIGICNFQLQKYEEASALLLKVQPLAQEEQQKKQIQYYLVMSYTSQNQLDKAVAAYDEFQSKYRGEAMADNLPVALGSMFLNAKDLDKAISYLEESKKIYPKGRLIAQTLLLQGNAYLQQRKFSEATQCYQNFLATNPKRESAASAELGLAGIKKDTGKTDEALAGYKAVRDKYEGLPEAEQGAFWVGQLSLIKGDFKTAATEMAAFIQKYPESQLRSAAMFALAQAQISTGSKDQALAGFKELLDKYPKSDAAPFACFQMASIYASDQKVEEMVGVMKHFIEQYPGNDKIYYAYDTIGQSQINAGKPLEAIATYSEMAEKYPDNAQTPEALLKVSTLWLQYSRAQGIYTALNEEQRAEWNKGVTNSLEIGSKLLEKYPGSQPVALTLQTLLDAQKLLATAKIKTPAEVESYFQELASKFNSNPALKTKVLFKLAAYLYEKDKAAGLQQMNNAYDSKLVYAPADIDLYGGALLDGGKLDEAQAVFEKLALDYPLPAQGPAAPQVQEAQAIALYGIGKSFQLQNKVAEAGAKFDQLKRLYPWSPKLLEANFGIAKALAQQKKLDDASNLLVQIIRAQTATAELRANSMLLGGDIQSEKGNLEAAIDYYIKIATFYEGVPTAAAEGLWKGGTLLEKQAAGLTETSKPTKAAQMAKAIKAYKDLVDKYPNAPFTAQAKARLQQLNVK